MSKRSLRDLLTSVAHRSFFASDKAYVEKLIKDAEEENGNHEEPDGAAISPVSAAVILADKSDVHRSRVRKSGQIEFDIHDRVNFAAEQSFLRVDSDAKTITLELTIDTEISQVMEYFEIFLGRMMMCRRAAESLDCTFKLTINGAALL